MSAPCRGRDDRAEQSALEEEARRLKAEVAEAVVEQEAAEKSARTADRKRWFSLFDADRSGGVGIDDMRASLQKLPGCEQADPEWAPLLIKRLDRDGDGELGLQEFDVQELRTAVRLLELEERESASVRQRSRSAAEDWVATIVFRICTCLPYLLPVLTHLDAPATGSGVMLSAWAAEYPLLAQSVVVLQAVDAFLFQEWWARILVFNALLLISILASQLPQLVRFNCLQAAVLFVLWYIPILTSTTLQSQGMTDLYIFDGPSLFYLLLVCVLYACVYSLNGRLPDGIPVVSGLARTGTQY